MKKPFKARIYLDLDVLTTVQVDTRRNVDSRLSFAAKETKRRVMTALKKAKIKAVVSALDADEQDDT